MLFLNYAVVGVPVLIGAWVIYQVYLIHKRK